MDRNHEPPHAEATENEHSDSRLPSVPLTKGEFMEAYTTVNRIEDLLSEAGVLFDKLPPTVQQAIHTYHNEHGSLQHCLRGGLQAVTELRKDWHTVVAGLPCGEPEAMV